ncbi:unnamed protein product, partial [Ilex paraguariensis]
MGEAVGGGFWFWGAVSIGYGVGDHWSRGKGFGGIVGAAGGGLSEQEVGVGGTVKVGEAVGGITGAGKGVGFNEKMLG